MKLVILGRGTLDELQTVVENTFGSIRANNGLGIDSSHDASNDLRSLHPSEIVFSLKTPTMAFLLFTHRKIWV